MVSLRSIIFREFSFSLTPQQSNKIANSRDLRLGEQDYTVQVQMRFSLLDTTLEQDDNFPPNLEVKINELLISAISYGFGWICLDLLD